MDEGWGYPKQERSFQQSGKFIGWAAGSAGSVGEPSAAAWRVEKIDGSEPPIECVKPSAAESTAPRANLAAAFRAIEVLPNDSEMELWTREKNVVDAINNDIDRWRKNNWQGSRKAPIANDDIVVAIAKLIETRRLIVRARKSTSELTQDKIVLRLKEEARKARAVRISELADNE